jgi:hypothetical protein
LEAAPIVVADGCSQCAIDQPSDDTAIRQESPAPRPQRAAAEPIIVAAGCRQLLKSPDQIGRGQIFSELCAPGGPDRGVEGTIAGDDDLTTARAHYRRAAASNPDRVVLLCDGGRVLARSDRASAARLG